MSVCNYRMQCNKWLGYNLEFSYVSVLIVDVTSGRTQDDSPELFSLK